VERQSICVTVVDSAGGQRRDSEFMTQTQTDGVAADTRTRTFSWSDPAATANQLGRRPGLEVLGAIAAGELPRPPVMDMIGMGALELTGPGTVTFLLQPREYHYNPLGSVHGGVLATILDSATGCAVHSTLPAGVGYTTADLSTKYLRPVTVASGELRCVGTVISSGRRTALAEARLTDAGGRLIAHATSTCLLFDIT
jgi:uncharacterized protein (TIGR00369 family)